MKLRTVILAALGLLLAVVAFGGIFASTATAAPAGNTAYQAGTTYIVQPGDTLWGISQRFGVSMDLIAQVNGISNPSLIYVGQTLYIPDPNAPTNTPVPTATPLPPTATPVPADPAATPTQETTGSVVEYTVQPGDTLSAIANRYNTTVEAISAYNNIDNPSRIFAGTVLKIVVGDKTTKPTPEATPTPQPTMPPAMTSGARWIDVNLSTQTLIAYEGDTQVFQTLISSGTANHPTVVGTFHIYTKLRYDDMTGGTGAEYYYLPNVPFVMYFYEGGYALHGTYWHHNFGTPMSHGCVNLATDDAEWLYGWAPLGTTVKIHY